MTVWYAGRFTALHTRQSFIYSNKYQVSRRYGIFSWWWAHSCPKHVEKSSKHIKKKIVHQVGSIYKIEQGYTLNKTHKKTKNFTSDLQITSNTT